MGNTDVAKPHTHLQMRRGKLRAVKWPKREKLSQDWNLCLLISDSCIFPVIWWMLILCQALRTLHNTSQHGAKATEEMQ